MNGRMWTEEERELLRGQYPDVKTATIAAELGRSLTTVYQQAAKLGLKKSQAFLESADACRLRRGDNIGSAFRFKKGQAPPNKGLRRPGWAPGRMRETQFKPGQRSGLAARNWRPLGTILPDCEGYLRIKVREGRKGEAYGFGNTDIWPLLQRHEWRKHHGAIPDGHTIVFKDGNRANCAIGNLECISRADLMRRNTIHNRYPKELGLAIQMLGAVKRKLRESNAKEHDDGSAQPSV